ncbi:hypothetical protein B0H12DRAFT_3819 [Mycena haematopus]|nr:hypothetical protein B0H12DRAFT_3819 [Mycena haematopus]
MLGGEDNWANAAVAGQHDPWGVHKTMQQSQWGGAIPTPAQLAAHQAAVPSGSKGGGGGGKKGNNQQKGAGKGAAHPQQAWEAWGTDNRPQAAADAWGNKNSAWGDANDWGPTADEKRRETTQSAKHAQGHWTGWSEEAKRLPKVTSVPQSSHVRPDLTTQQHSEILRALLNQHNPLQGHDARAAYEQQKRAYEQQRGGQWDAQGAQQHSEQWDDWGGQQKGGQWDAWGGQHEQQKGEQQKGGKKNKQNKQDNQQGNKQENNKQKNKKNQQQQQQQKQQKQKKQQQNDPWATGGWDAGVGGATGAGGECQRKKTIIPTTTWTAASTSLR